MKKLLSLLLLATALHADTTETEKLNPAPGTQAAPVAVEMPVASEDAYGSFILNEVKLGYFRFGDKRLRHAYDKGVLDVQLTSSFRFWEPLYIYGSVEYIQAEGRFKDHAKSTVRIVPLSLGLQYIQPITFDLKYYLTLGPRYFFFHQAGHHSSGLGGFANTGFIYYLSRHIVVDFFGEYSYKRMNHLQVGGLTLGAGIGYFW